MTPPTLKSHYMGPQFVHQTRSLDFANPWFYGDFVMEPDGTIFLPWALAGCSEMEVFLCAGYDGDGQPVVRLGKISLYRANWLKDNFPKMREVIDRGRENDSGSKAQRKRSILYG
jgi:hypothetical protein